MRNEVEGNDFEQSHFEMNIPMSGFQVRCGWWPCFLFILGAKHPEDPKEHTVPKQIQTMQLTKPPTDLP